MTPVLFLIFGPPVKEQQQGLELLHGARLYEFIDEFMRIQWRFVSQIMGKIAKACHYSSIL